MIFLSLSEIEQGTLGTPSRSYAVAMPTALPWFDTVSCFWTKYYISIQLHWIQGHIEYRVILKGHVYVIIILLQKLQYEKKLKFIFKCCGNAVWRRNAPPPIWIYVVDLQMHAGKIVLYFNVLFITKFLFLLVLLFK